MTNNTHQPWYRDHRLWLEGFVIANIAMLTADIYLAHLTNHFRRPAEYLPFYFSMAAPVVLLVALPFGWRNAANVVWRDLGMLVGWLAIAIGLIGVILHLRSGFFYQRTIKSLVYAAPFAAPLAYTGLGLLVVMNRMVDQCSTEWAYWVLLMALGGFFGNFVFSLTDHAQNGFFHWAEWLPVVTSALAVGFLAAPFFAPIGKTFVWLCAAVLALQAIVGVIGFVLHNAANLASPGASLLEKVVHGAPSLAPLLFADLVLLAAIGLVVLVRQQWPPAEAPLDSTVSMGY